MDIEINCQYSAYQAKLILRSVLAAGKERFDKSAFAGRQVAEVLDFNG